MLNRSEQLRQDGFTLVRKADVALPHQVWKVDLEIEEDQPMRLSDETILGLIEAGVHSTAEVAALMGVEPDVAVESRVIELLRRGFLAFQDGLTITRAGKSALVEQTVRVARRFDDLSVRYDPYEDNFRWKLEGETFKDAQPAHPLPIAQELQPLDLSVRQSEIEHMIREWGLPFEKERQKGEKEVQRDLVRLTARRAFCEWRRATLEVWYREVDAHWDWRLLYMGGEVPAISAKLRTLAGEGRDIIPLEVAPAAVPVPEVRQAHDIIEAIQTRSRVLATEHHRPVLKELIDEMKRELIIVSPWLTGDAVDDELLGWLEKALKRNRNAVIHIGYGIGSDGAAPNDRKARDQERVLQKLKALSQRFGHRLRVVEIGNTHEKIVIRDGKEAISTSFNWLSFNPKPGKAVRRETGYRIDDARDVDALREAFAPILGL